MADKGKTPPKGGKGKGAAGGGGGKGGSGGGGGGGGGGKMLSGVVKSVELEAGSGLIQPEGDGEVHSFDLKKLEGKEVVVGQKVQFKSAGKKGKKEANDVVLVEGEAAEEPKKEEETVAKSEEPAPEKKEEEAPKEEPKKESAAKAEEAKEAAAAAAASEKKEEKKEDKKERTLRDDDECFIADYTANKPEQKVKKFESFSTRRARIARDIVDEDPDVELRVRKEPNLDAEELMVIGADDTVEVVGRCGEWVRLAGDEERWMLSEKNEVKLIEVWTAGWMGGSWTLGFGGITAEEKKAEAGEEEGKKESAGSGWGFGSMSSYVPTGMLEGLSKNILAAGASYEEGEEGRKRGGGEEGAPAAFPRPPTEEEKGAETQRKAAAAAPDLTDDITSTVDKTFNKEMELTEGGLAPVRYVSKGINMVEGVVGWLGSTAKEQAQGVSKTVQEKAGAINTDELMEKAWSGVKGGVQASSHAASNYGKMVSETATHVANTDAVKSATGYGKTVLSTVGNTVINAAGTVLSAGGDGKTFPNRELGGVLGIEISGVIVVRNPDVDEDEDPFCSDKFDAVPMVPDAVEAIRLLVEQRFADKVLLISVASPGVQAKMMRWLTNRSFYDKTGISRDNVVFCRELDEKEDVCKEKNITVMLESSSTGAGMASKAGVETVLTFGDGAEASEATQPLDDGSPAATKWWKDVLDALLPLSVAEPQVEEAEEGEGEKAAAKEEATE